MSLARGKFGIEYNPKPPDDEPGGFGWLVAALVALALVSLSFALWKRFHRVTPEFAVTRVPAPAIRTPVACPEPTPELVKAAPLPVIADVPLPGRPQKVKNLLMRLEEAERRRDVEMAVSTIEQLRGLPGSPAADLDDQLARRLGTLNLRRLYKLHNAQWVREVLVRPGDAASRLAAEHGSTYASCVRLNGGAEKTTRLRAGQKLFVMDHPRFQLVLHRRTRTADLWLNGKFFKRYDLTAVPAKGPGAFKLTLPVRSFWKDLGAEFKANDRAEIEEFLPKGTPVLISEM